MRIGCAVLAFLLLGCACVSAQDSAQWRIYGGYQFTRFDSSPTQTFLAEANAFDPSVPLINYGTRRNLNGWDLGIEQDGRWGIGVVVDASGNYATKNITLSSVGGVTEASRTRLRYYTVGAGPQFVMHKSSNVQPFVHVLLGAGWYSDNTEITSNGLPVLTGISEQDTKFVVTAGAGANMFFSSHIGVRVAGDYMRTFFFDANQNNYRGTVGLVIRF